MSSSNLRARQTVLGIVALSLFAALFTRLWYLQVLTTDEYEVAAEAVRTERVILEAPRGRILDRQGKVLVENARTIQVSVDWQDFTDLSTPEQSELLRNLSREITLDEQLRFQGLRLSCDPGGREPEEAGAATAPLGEGDGDGEGEGGEGAATTTPSGTDPTEPDGTDSSEPSGTVPAVAQVDDETCANRPPPAGVATGADNPDGESDTGLTAPDPVTDHILRERIDDRRFSKFKPVPVARGISEELEARITENPDLFPTVVVERTTVRKYNYGALAAHVLGYVGSITEDELELYQNPDKPYENDDEIGKAGIERGMEEDLRGTPGLRVYEVDARNRPIREIESDYRAPVPGRDVYLTLDINMQYLMEEGLAVTVAHRTGVRDNGCFQPETDGCDPQGAASVAIDPRDGQVLAMASYPTYDPNLFVGGISSRDYEAIADERRKDIHHNPLFNRAIRGEYAPGSTFKLFSAYAALANGIIGPGDYYDDTGVYLYDPDCPTDSTVRCSAKNAGSTAHGSVNLSDALRVSSDTYFYRLGDLSWRAAEAGRLPEDAMQARMKDWGLNAETGIDLPGERPGRIPTPEWLRDYSLQLNGDTELGRDAGTWRAGTSGNTMVGQGDVLVTPLQLALGYGALANGGTVWEPQLVLQVTDFAARTNAVVIPATETGRVDLPPEWRDPMIEGFDGVTKAAGGTATSVFQGLDQSVCPIAGKTGTAQATNQNDSSLFTAFAPTPTEGRTSTIAMATVFEQAGFGASAAAPLTRWVLQPFAEYGCDINAFGAPGNPDTGVPASRYTAPLGGWFDVEAGARAISIPEATTED